MRNSKKWIISVAVLLCYVSTPLLFCGCSTSGNIITMKESAIPTNNGEGQLITISTFNSEGVGSIWAYDCNKEKVTPLLTNKKVMVSGSLNVNRDILAFSDAPGDSPWDIFTLDLNNNRVQQVTSDETGQFKVCFSEITSNIIYAQAGGKDSPVPRIARIDIENNKTEYLNICEDNDCGVGCFDILNDKMIILTYSFSKDIKRHTDKSINKLKDLPNMEYNIYILDLKSNYTKKVLSFNAQRIDSISWSANGSDVIMSGADIDGSTGAGFYKFSMNDKVVKQLISEDTIKSTKQITSFSSPYCLCESVDNHKFYFSAVPIGAEKIVVDGMVYFPSCLYCYDLSNNKLKEVFSEPNTFITALSTTY